MKKKMYQKIEFDKSMDVWVTNGSEHDLIVNPFIPKNVTILCEVYNLSVSEVFTMLVEERIKSSLLLHNSMRY